MSRSLYAAIFLPLALLLIVTAAFSLRWPLIVDAPILVYEGHIMAALGMVPYRDFFDMNMPGTLLLHRLMVSAVGTGEAALRVVELLWLAAILGVTWALMRTLSRQAATASAVIFGLAHLAYGPYFGLQREFIILLPVALSILVLQAGGTSRLLRSPPLRTFLAALLVGGAATIKPHALLSLPLVVAFQWLAGDPGEPGKNGSRPPGRVVHLAAALCGGALPLVAVLAWLAAHGALGAFLEMARGYWPLYTRLSVSHQTIAGIDRVIYMIRGFSRMGENGLWLVPALLGLSLALFHARLERRARALVLLLAGHAVVYAIYPLVAGQFWVYHYLPFLYFTILLGSLCLLPVTGEAATGQRRLAIGALLLVTLLRAHPPLELLTRITGGRIEEARMERVSRIASYLESAARPGDRVQPLDWTGGAVHAMLRSGSDPATPFLYDFHFYHHVSSPYIQGLRARFVRSMEEVQPRFVIRIEEDRPWPWGRDTTRSFPELQQLLARSYRVALRGEGWEILERAAAG